LTVHVQRVLDPLRSVRVTFTAPALPEHGYYYAVFVLRAYRHYTRSSPPPCATSSDMQRTDYGYPDATGTVVLRVTQAHSQAGHWCRRGSYEAAIYAVPHPPPCNSEYPCSSEPRYYPRPCTPDSGKCIPFNGIVALPRQWRYPEALPSPHAAGASIDARFTVAFPAGRAGRG
jgi:hypothetical protein